MTRNANTLGLKEQHSGINPDRPLLFRQRLFTKKTGPLNTGQASQLSWKTGMFMKARNNLVVGPLIGWGYPIKVNQNGFVWSDPDRAIEDIQAQTSMEDSASVGLEFVLWHGPDHPTDYATLAIMPGNFNIWFCPFTTPPVNGEIIYIIGVYSMCRGSFR